MYSNGFGRIPILSNCTWIKLAWNTEGWKKILESATHLCHCGSQSCEHHTFVAWEGRVWNLKWGACERSQNLEVSISTNEGVLFMCQRVPFCILFCRTKMIKVLHQSQCLNCFFRKYDTSLHSDPPLLTFVLYKYALNQTYQIYIYSFFFFGV